MKSLNHYIEEKNIWKSVFNEKPIRIDNISQNDINFLCSSLNADLSPENLTCDGEISRSEVNNKYLFYKQVASELKEFSILNDFFMPEIYELY